MPKNIVSFPSLAADVHADLVEREFASKRTFPTFGFGLGEMERSIASALRLSVGQSDADGDGALWPLAAPQNGWTVAGLAFAFARLIWTKHEQGPSRYAQDYLGHVSPFTDYNIFKKEHSFVIPI